MSYRTRFAPSPTGPLHLGHAYSALIAFERAKAKSGTFLLRIEDIDTGRSRNEWESAIFDDLHWLGLVWPEPVLRQSQNLPAYRAALDQLWRMGLLYVCRCNRREIAAAARAPQEGDPLAYGPDGIIYPGTCRPPADTSPAGPLPLNAVLRLNIAAAVPHLPNLICFTETGAGPAGETGEVTFPPAALIHTIGDIVVARREMGTSYHLSVVVDDAAQGITEVVRGEDLFDATTIHVVLQHLLGFSVPDYHHHALQRDATGKRLAKRDDALAIARYRAQGERPQDIRNCVGL
ncbi:MAG: tRNA glutamyl-Q(34) synthetase GluQRS [Pseudomonadota bacterium]